jgi:lipid-A-disaccharide synthase
MPGLIPYSGTVRQGGLRVGLIAGEPSGDLLGAGLVREIRRYYPDATFCGIAGPAMLAEGVTSWVPMERLSVMGIVEVLRHLPELLQIRRRVTRGFTDLRPDVVIGIDSPDFTLGVERRLRAAGIRTVHYVSPSVWAWRAGRIDGIGKAAELVLCLLPFEPELYAAHGIPAVFVGHPMADAIPMTPDRAASRAALGIVAAEGEVIALLPGSRMGEVERLGAEFAAAAARLAARRPGVRFIAAMASAPIRERFQRTARERRAGRGGGAVRRPLARGHGRRRPGCARLGHGDAGGGAAEAPDGRRIPGVRLQRAHHRDPRAHENRILRAAERAGRRGAGA